MALLIVKIRGTAPLGFGKRLVSQQEEGETYVDWENRCWQERAHVDKEGNVFIPAVTWTKMIQASASRIGMKIPGEQRRTFNKEFECGVYVDKNTPIGKKLKELNKLTLFVPSDGKKGGKNRVMKHFPIAEDWGCTIEFHILNPRITEPVFMKHLKWASIFSGVGMSRPQNGGNFGRYEILSAKWQTEEIDGLVQEYLKMENKKVKVA